MELYVRSPSIPSTETREKHYILLLLLVYGCDVLHAWREETCTRSVARNIRKRPLRRRCDNIKMDVRSLGLDFVDWLHLTQDKTVGWLL